MRSYLKFIVLFVMSNIFVACASGYSSLKVNNMEFRSVHETRGLEISYKYNILEEAGNGRYSGYEDDENINIVGIKIKNTSDSSITLTKENFKVYAGSDQLNILNYSEVTDQMGQSPYIYLLYSLLFLQIQGGDNVTTIPIGVPIALLNVLRASMANSSFEEDLQQNSVLNKEIKSGETVYGIIPLYNSKFTELHFESRL